jgi:hypothetical protein
MQLIDIELAIKELPETYGKLAHEAEVARSAFEVAQQCLAMKEAGDTLKLQVVKVEGESQTKMNERIKNQVIVDTHDEVLEVLKLKSSWKKLELEADIISKKIMLLCKSTDLYLSETYQTGRLDKAVKPMFSSNSGTYQKSGLGRD